MHQAIPRLDVDAAQKHGPALRAPATRRPVPDAGSSSSVAATASDWNATAVEVTERGARAAMDD
jgi:hypothetical protein